MSRQYNPTVVYGTPYVTPGYSTAAVVTTAVLAFGVGIAVGAAMSNSWGYSYWNCNWHGGTVVYGSTGYYGNSAWHGGYYGSARASAYGPYGSAHASAPAITHPPGLMRAARRRRRLRHAGGWTGLQPEHGSLRRHASSLQRLWELRKLGRLQERQYRLHAACKLTANGTVASAQTSAGGSARRRIGQVWQQRSRGPNRKWQ